MNQKNSLMTSLRKKLTLSTSIYGKRCFVNKCSIEGFVVDQHQKYVKTIYSQLLCYHG
jgi:hypothetical protein